MFIVFIMSVILGLSITRCYQLTGNVNYANCSRCKLSRIITSLSPYNLMILLF